MSKIALVLVIVAVQSAAAQTTQPASDEFERLADQILNVLKWPVDWAHDRDPGTEEFRSALNLAGEWPHPKFRARLIELLDHEDANVVLMAAHGVFKYGDPAAIGKVRELLKGDRVVGGGCIMTPLKDRITELLAESPDPRFCLSSPDTLPMEQTQHFSPYPNLEFGCSPGMTLGRAILLLKDPSFSIRVKAFGWLAARGIIVEIEPFESAWKRANELQRAGLFCSIGNGGERIGRDRLRPVLERLARSIARERTSELTRSCLALGLAHARSPLAREFALPIIRSREGAMLEATSQPWKRMVETSTMALSQSLDALTLIADSRDRDHALRWRVSSNDIVSEGAFCLLARLDDESAVAAVEERLKKLKKASGLFTKPNLIDSIRSREWRDQNIKWRYILALNQRMQLLVGGWNEKSAYPPDLHEVDDIIHTLEALTRVINGPDSFCSPGFNKRRSLETAHNWNQWVKAKSPSQ